MQALVNGLQEMQKQLRERTAAAAATPANAAGNVSVTRRWFGLLILALAALPSRGAFPQSSPSSSYSTIEAIPGKQVEIGYHASATRNCSSAPLPTIRVVQPPGLGILIVREGMSTTERVAGCCT